MDGIAILFYLILGAAVVGLYVVLVVLFVRMSNDVRVIKKRFADKDSDYYRYSALAKEEHHLGNVDKEREYLRRAQCCAEYDYQAKATQKYLDMIDGITEKEDE